MRNTCVLRHLSLATCCCFAILNLSSPSPAKKFVDFCYRHSGNICRLHAANAADRLVTPLDKMTSREERNHTRATCWSTCECRCQVPSPFELDVRCSVREPTQSGAAPSLLSSFRRGVQAVPIAPP